MPTTAAAAAAAASRAAYVAYGWAERFSQICDELIEALEARVDADLWIEFSVEQISETFEEFASGYVYCPYTGERVDDR